MKILMVSMFSSHFFNWVKQLENKGHEIYWIDAYDSNTYVEKIDFVNQIVGWRNRIKYPGRYKIKKYFPNLYNLINKLNQRDLSKVFEKKIREIRPDVIQSFEMFSSTLPIIEVMENNPQLPWIYSIWGNDLFHFLKEGEDEKNLKRVLARINYLFADCHRDFELAKALGYSNICLGVFPTGGGYDFKKYDIYIKKREERNVILIKGYQHTFGRCNIILEAIRQMKESLIDYEIIVFGANKEVMEFAAKKKLHQWKNFKIYEQISHKQVLKIMGNSLIYIGNSVSDGMPNTLLESIIMGAFPIQSNPGGVTKEIITDGINGFLINDPEDPGEIVSHLKRALTSPETIENANEYNFKFIKPGLERNLVGEKVLDKYRFLEEQLNK